MLFQYLRRNDGNPHRSVTCPSRSDIEPRANLGHSTRWHCSPPFRINPRRGQAPPARALGLCPVCQAGSFSPRFVIKGIAIEACSGCGLVVQNPQPSDAQLAAIYGSNYFIGSSENDRLGSQFDLVKRATASLQLDEIAAYLSKRGQAAKPLSLLEVGCGHGNMLLEARNRGYQVHGLEYSADAARVANDKLGAEVVRVGAITKRYLPRAILRCLHPRRRDRARARSGRVHSRHTTHPESQAELSSSPHRAPRAGPRVCLAGIGWNTSPSTCSISTAAPSRAS